ARSPAHLPRHGADATCIVVVAWSALSSPASQPLLVMIEEAGLPESLTRRTPGDGTCAHPKGGRHRLGTVARLRSESWPASNRNPRRECVGIRSRQMSGPPDSHVGNRDQNRGGAVTLRGSRFQNRQRACQVETTGRSVSRRRPRGGPGEPADAFFPRRG